jgi:hypothetical protein
MSKTMMHKMFGVGVFALLVAILEMSSFVIEPTPMQYVACVLWSGMVGWGGAVIAKRTAARSGWHEIQRGSEESITRS